MQQVSWSLVGVRVLAGFRVIAGVAALGRALEIATFTAWGFAVGGSIALGLAFVAVLVVLGLVNLRRAYRLWALHRDAWRTEFVLACASSLIAALSLAAAPFAAAGWTHLAASLATVVYLCLPEVRSLFA